MLPLVLMSRVMWVWKVIVWSVEAVCISGPMHLCVQLSGGFWEIDPWGKYARIWSCIVFCFTVLLGNCCLPLLETVHLCCCLFKNCTSFSWNCSDGCCVVWHSAGSELLGCSLHADMYICICIHKRNRSAIFYRNLKVISNLQFVCSAAVNCDPCTCLCAQYLPYYRKGACLQSQVNIH
jgi:hypothetical protein